MSQISAYYSVKISISQDLVTKTFSDDIEVFFGANKYRVTICLLYSSISNDLSLLKEGPTIQSQNPLQ